MTPKKSLLVIILNINEAFLFGFFSSLGNSKKELPINGLCIEVFTYSPFIDSTTHPVIDSV